MKKLACLFFITLILQLSGCKEDDYATINQELVTEQTKNTHTSVSLTWEEATNESVLQKLLEKFGEIKSEGYYLKNGNTKEKKVLKLKKSKVNKITIGSDESFTISIEESNLTNINFSNLLLTKNGDKERAFIINYYPKQNWAITYARGTLESFEGRITIMEIKIDDYILKSIDCDHVVVYIDSPCTGVGPDGPCEHIVGEDCGCTENPNCDEPSRTILFDGYVCYDPYSGGEQTYYDSDPNESTNTSVSSTSGSGGTPAPAEDTNQEDEIFATRTIFPYNPEHLEAITIVNNLFNIELGNPADIAIDNLTLFDPSADIVLEGENIAYDKKGGFYFYDRGYLIYYRAGICYIYIDEIDEWYDVGIGLNYFFQYIEDSLKEPVTTLLTFYAMVTPIDDFMTLISGTDINNIKQNRYLAGTFLLLEVIPGTKLLKPVTNTLGNGFKYFFGYGGKMLDLTKANGIVKFTDNTILELAEKATKFEGAIEPEKVMLGKFGEGGIFYTKEAQEFGCIYYNLDNWDDLKNLVEGNKSQMWEINKRFIINNKGKTFYMSHDPDFATDYFKNEIELIKSWDGFIRFEQEGDYWKAIFN